MSTVDFGTILSSAAEDAAVIGPDLTIEQQIEPGVMVQADPYLLQMVIQATAPARGRTNPIYCNSNTFGSKIT
jgi:hypothetical protein